MADWPEEIIKKSSMHKKNNQKIILPLPQFQEDSPRIFLYLINISYKPAQRPANNNTDFNSLILSAFKHIGL